MTDVKVPIARCAGCKKDLFAGDIAYEMLVTVISFPCADTDEVLRTERRYFCSETCN